MAGWKETEGLELWGLLSLVETAGSLALNLHYHCDCETNHWKCLQQHDEMQSYCGCRQLRTHLMSNFVVSGDVGGCREGALPLLPPAWVTHH